MGIGLEGVEELLEFILSNERSTLSLWDSATLCSSAVV